MPLSDTLSWREIRFTREEIGDFLARVAAAADGRTIDRLARQLGAALRIDAVTPAQARPMWLALSARRESLANRSAA